MEPRGVALPWKHCLHLCLLLVQLSLPEVSASCRILRCNSDFVAAKLDLGAGGNSNNNNNNTALTVNAGYCGALRSYATCTRRTARACRGDLAYHSAVQGIEDLLIQHRCPRAGPTAPPRHRDSAFGDACLYESSLLAREGRAPDYLHCGVFGDPHVRTFNNEFMTCGVQGAWPLVDNDFLFIQATSAPTRGEKISIIFKSSLQCGDQQLYQAELDDVPAAFADGSVSGGERRGRHSLTVRTQTPGRHAEIHAAHIGTLLVVRQTGRSLGLSLRSPRGVVESPGGPGPPAVRLGMSRLPETRHAPPADARRRRPGGGGRRGPRGVRGAASRQRRVLPGVRVRPDRHGRPERQRGGRQRAAGRREHDVRRAERSPVAWQQRWAAASGAANAAADASAARHAGNSGHRRGELVNL
ncbi:hypothetical protein EPR50_G00057850 [Perca flavescens]|uniref:Hemojuvelin BMP co-receptor n=1 Tax=Perca flavescens TaxID=8167 RepID=A0A484D6R1_PERFV|nr:hypothetical protein EPR50_G00057850 [Perca flavescens]